MCSIYSIKDLPTLTLKITELQGKSPGTIGSTAFIASSFEDFLFEIPPDGDLMPSFSVKPFKPRIYETRS